MNQTLYIMQGAPGSGKSTIAKDIALSNAIPICSTDDYHYENIKEVKDPEGWEKVSRKYIFKPDKLQAFHEANLVKCKDFLSRGYSVIVDNTNIKKFAAKPYIDYAKEKGIPVVIIRCYGKFPNVHGVPQEKVDKMRSEMEDLSELL